MSEKEKSDWVTARQYLSETDEAWGERLTSLTDAMEDSGVVRTSELRHYPTIPALASLRCTALEHT